MSYSDILLDIHQEISNSGDDWLDDCIPSPKDLTYAGEFDGLIGLEPTSDDPNYKQGYINGVQLRLEGKSVFAHWGGNLK